MSSRWWQFFNRKYWELSSYVESVVSPTSKLERTILVIEWEPSDVNLTGGFEDAWSTKLEWPRVVSTWDDLTWWYVGAEPSTGDHDVGLIGPIKGLTCTAIYVKLKQDPVVLRCLEYIDKYIIYFPLGVNISISPRYRKSLFIQNFPIYIWGWNSGYW